MKIRTLLFISLLLLPEANTNIIPCVLLPDLRVKGGFPFFLATVNISGTKRAKSCPRVTYQRHSRSRKRTYMGCQFWPTYTARLHLDKICGEFPNVLGTP